MEQESRQGEAGLMANADSRQGVIIVTGSSGLIGSSVIERLAEEFTVIGFDREGSPHPPPMAECVCVDLTSEESVRQGLARVRQGYGEHVTSVIHLAAYYDFSGEPSPKYDEVTVQGTQRLLRALQTFQVEQFIFSSTMLVHAPCQPGQRIDEDWPIKPTWAYPESKVKTEELILAERGTTPVVLLRIAGVYTDRCHSIPLAHQIQRIYERKLVSHVFPGHIAHGQSFLHLDDLIDACVRLVQRQKQLPPVLPLLVGEEEILSYDELQHQFSRLIHDEEWETREIPQAVAQAGAWVQGAIPFGEEPFIKPWMIDHADDHYALDTTQVRTLLHWEPKRSLRDTLPLMIDALKTDPPAWYREHQLDMPSRLTELPHEQGKMERADPQATPPENHPFRHQALKNDTHQGMSDPEHEAMLLQNHKKFLWTYYTNLLLGMWLLTSPVTLGYQTPGMIWNDVLSGTLVLVFGTLALFRRVWAGWIVCFLGIWLLFAPLIFWAPTAAAYLNDTLVGSFIIALSVLIPGMPGMGWMDMPGPEIPPGWTYNPSSWLQRGPIIGLAFVGFFIARYLTAYQLGHIPAAWDPFFGESTQKVLTSKVSKVWPIPDAGLGALSYMLEGLSGFMGDSRRWRTMPWMVLMFALLVVPLGATSIILVILQPVSIGMWCTLCLIAAAGMLVMVPLAVDEVIAMGQFMKQSQREGKPFWRTFWMGGSLEGKHQDTRSPQFGATASAWVPSMMWGVTLPWTLAVSTALGIWLMVAPSVFGTTGAAANSNYLMGALVVTFAVIAWAEVCRSARWFNVLFGLWLMAAPWFLNGSVPESNYNSFLVGFLLLVLSIPRGEIRERYGTWARYII